MRDVITLGPAPAGEPWARIDQCGYAVRAHAHCSAYMRQLRRQFGSEPPGAELQEIAVSIPGGSCLMVVCYFETGHVDALAYALRCDTDALTTWDAEARRELAAYECNESIDPVATITGTR